MPGGKENERFKNQINQLLKNEWLPPKYRLKKKSEFVQIQITKTESEKLTNTTETPVDNKRISKDCDILENQKAQLMWDKGSQMNKSFRKLYRSFWRGDKIFPPQYAHWKISLGECSLNPRGILQFRNRTLVPEWEPLRTHLIQKTHDSHVIGHPGRNSTFAILQKSFHWPGISQIIKRFCRNCDVCGKSHLWKKRRKGFLKPLPVPDRFHSELSIDFITNLPAKREKNPRFLMVITNRLLKSCTLKAITFIKAENCAEIFVQYHYRFHKFPKFITSNKGSN
jgi:hypothetical protein